MDQAGPTVNLRAQASDVVRAQGGKTLELALGT